jgi:hypothetical protein
MATVHELHLSQSSPPEGILSRLARLLQLELELGLAETREVVVSALIALAIAVAAVVASIASLVVLIVGACAPLFHTRWEHLVISGGGVLLVSIVALVSGALRLRRLRWPRETLASFEENWRWLAAQLRSRLTSP